MERLPLFDDYFSRNFLRPHIQKIAEALESMLQNTTQPGWMTGLGGMAVFFAHYHSDQEDQPQTQLCLEKIVARINDGFAVPTFAAGIMGILWVFDYLGEQKLINATDAQVLDPLLPFVRNYAEQELRQGNFDTLHGGGGYTFLGKDPLPPELWLNQDTLPWRDRLTLDLGLAHGLPSYILQLTAYLLQIENHPESGRHIPELKKNRQTALDLLLSQQTDHSSSAFPTRIKDGLPEFPSRMAWCYGDVGIALSLYRMEHDLHPRAEKVLLQAAKRTNTSETGVGDPYFCHGSAGLAFMYYKAWVLSKNDKFRASAQFWTRETIRFLASAYPAGKICEKQGMTFGDGSLLNGLSGIGLSLLAIERGTLSGWEKGLLI